MLDSRLVLFLAATLVPAVSLAEPSTADAAPEESSESDPVGPATLAEFADGPSRAVPPPPELTGLYQQVAPSVVRVKTFEGSGSGFLLGDDIVATAWHVVSDCMAFVVELRDGTELDATLFSYSTRDDLAILKLERPVDAPALELAPSAPDIGAPAYAIGSPLLEDFPGPSKRHEGLLAWSFTEGLVSAVGERQVQVTASVQPGNSGGRSSTGRVACSAWRWSAWGTSASRRAPGSCGSCSMPGRRPSVRRR